MAFDVGERAASKRLAMCDQGFAERPILQPFQVRPAHVDMNVHEVRLVADRELARGNRLHRARREFIALLRANTYDWELPA